MQKKILYTIISIVFGDCLMFLQIFLLLQQKRCPIITYKHGIYEFPHELLNNLGLKILGIDEILRKYLNLID